MAKSKSGGTRSYLRGRIGSDVFSVGKDGKGKKQQVVRSLAEVVSNPQTQAQMAGRALMSTIMQAVSAMQPIIDHSFDGFSKGQPSISQFIKTNYAILKQGANLPQGICPNGAIVAYGAKGVVSGKYVIANGAAQVPAAFVKGSAASLTYEITGLTAGYTKADVMNLLGLTDEEYLTVCSVYGSASGKGFHFIRLRFNPNMAADTEISASNIAELFATEGNISPTFAFASTKITLSSTDWGSEDKVCNAVVVSKKTSTGYAHNYAQLSYDEETSRYYGSVETNFATYPIGRANFLNGGDVNGMSENVPESGGDEEGD